MIKKPTRQFELINTLENKLHYLNSDFNDTADKYESLKSKYTHLKEKCSSLEQQVEDLKEKNQELLTVEKPAKLDRNHSSLMKDLEYWKTNCKRLASRVEYLETTKENTSDITHMKLLVGLSTLLDTEDPIQMMGKLKAIQYENVRLNQENHSMQTQLSKTKEIQHQYRQITEQLHEGFEKRLEMSKNALKDTYMMLQQKNEQVNSLNKSLNEKESQLSHFKFELNSNKQIHKQVVQDYQTNIATQSAEFKKLNDKTTTSLAMEKSDLLEKIVILQKDISTSKHREFLLNREIADLKSNIVQDNKLWLQEQQRVISK